MTATLSTRLVIRTLGPREQEIEVDYEYIPKPMGVLIEAVVAMQGKRQTPVAHLLTPAQDALIERQCMDDYNDRMMAVSEDRDRDHIDE